VKRKPPAHLKSRTLYASGESVRQLSLFPERGFALFCLNRLLIDHRELPAVEPTRFLARKRLRRCAKGESAWVVDRTAIVPVEVHHGADGAPLYVIEGI